MPHVPEHLITTAISNPTEAVGVVVVGLLLAIAVLVVISSLPALLDTLREAFDFRNRKDS